MEVCGGSMEVRGGSMECPIMSYLGYTGIGHGKLGTSNPILLLYSLYLAKYNKLESNICVALDSIVFIWSGTQIRRSR